MSFRLKLFLLCFSTLCMGLAQNDTNSTLTICWDTSYSMQERQLDQELSFLDSLITGQKITQVQLLNFSNSVEETNFTIKNNDWSTLKQALMESTYDGATNYQALNEVTKKGKGVFFTDGNKVFENHFLSLDKGDLLVSSKAGAHYKTLQLWEFINRATFVNLSNDTKTVFDEDEPNINGVVYMDGKPLSNVLIRSSAGLSSITDVNGRFKMRGKEGDTLSVVGADNQGLSFAVTNDEDEIKFLLDSKTIALEEVTVSEERLQELETVDFGYVKMEQKAVGFAVYEIPEERISEIETTVTDVLQEVPGLLMSSNSSWDPRNYGLSTARVRGKSSLSFDPKVLVVVDGTPLQRSRNHVGEQNATYFHIDPQNIKSIKVLKGLSATNLYGSEGSGGVILITTKTGSISKGSNGKPVDQARLTNNIFDGKLISKKVGFSTPYLKELKKAKGLKEAYEVYLNQRKKFLKEYWYFIDVSDYFRTANVQLADKVLSNLLEIPFEYDALRTLFLKYLNLGQNKRALAVAEFMIKNYPDKTQAYFDAATAQQKLGNYQVATDMFNDIVTGRLNPELDFAPLKKVTSTTLQNLINQHGGKLDLSKVESIYKNNVTYNARLRFDWASPQNQFILKFVNPQKRFFDWDHSSISNAKKIKDEIVNGYGTEQFELIGDLAKGKWDIYITNLSAKEIKAPYWVKCTIDYNFGKPNQRSEEKLIRLDPSDDKEQLFFELMVN